MLYRREDIFKIIKQLNNKEAQETTRKKWKKWRRSIIPYIQFESLGLYNEQQAMEFINYDYSHSNIRTKQDYSPIVIKQLLLAYCGIVNTDIRSQSDARGKNSYQEEC